MNVVSRLVLVVSWMLLTVAVKAQGPLPDISVRELTKGKVQVSWINPYETCIQLAIQRSTDSVNNFRTIFSSLSPELPANGFLDTKPLRGIKSYYRIFYVLMGGAYYFSKAVPVEVKWVNPVPGAAGGGTFRSIPVVKELQTDIRVKGVPLFTLGATDYAHFRDSIVRETRDNLKRLNDHTVEWTPAPARKDEQFIYIYQREKPLLRLTTGEYQHFKDSIASKTKDTLYLIDPFRIQLRPYFVAPSFISVFRNDSLVRKLDPLLYKKFRDSMMLATRDTLFSINNFRLDIHPFVPVYAWRPSEYVFTNTKGYVTVLLPLVKQHRYRIVFFDEDNSEIFQIKSVKETELVLDKANFVHAGWFSFELYEDDKLKEKNKFYLARE